MQDSVSPAFPELQAHYRDAFRSGFPAFLGDIKASNPINATPYVTSLSQFIDGGWAGERKALIDTLVTAIAQLRESGLGVEILLVGGSFLDARKTPRDLDCGLFYSRELAPTIDLSSWQSEQREKGLDVRLIPIDADPVIVLKMALYFGVLYTKGRESQQQLRGLVLVDCSK